jgi:hypothetical protein
MFLDFILDILFPLLIALVVISIVLRLVSMLLELIKLDLVPIRIIAFLGVYYFVGPYLLEMVEGKIFTNIHPFAKFFYTPVQHLLEIFM